MSQVGQPLQALDIVLVPDAISIAKLISIARQPWIKQDLLVLDPIKVVPHLTLGMAFTRKRPSLDSLPLGSLKGGFTTQVSGVYHADTVAGVVGGLEVANHPALQYLHEAAIGLLGSQDEYQEKPNLSSLANPDAADLITLEWIKNFHYGTGLNYNPHVTLGFVNRETDLLQLGQYQDLSIHFSHVALYQLGNYCTCQVLHELIAL